MDILAVLFYVLIAALCAFIAGRMAPGIIPGGFFTAATVGVLGAWAGGSVLGQFGPALAGVALLPSILGASILVFVLSLCSRGLKHKSA